MASAEENGWPDEVVGPSDVPHAAGYAKPKALTKEEIEVLKGKWVAATKRAEAAGRMCTVSRFEV